MHANTHKHALILLSLITHLFCQKLTRLDDLPVSRFSQSYQSYTFTQPKVCFFLSSNVAVKTLHEVLMEQEHYEFLEYAQQAGVSEMLKGETETKENFTIFVPSTECFQSKFP